MAKTSKLIDMITVNKLVRIPLAPLPHHLRYEETRFYVEQVELDLRCCKCSSENITQSIGDSHFKCSDCGASILFPNI